MATIKHTLAVPTSQELHQSSSDELREILKDLRSKKMRIDGKNKSPMATPLAHPSGEARQNRKTIARILTILVQRKERCL